MKTIFVTGLKMSKQPQNMSPPRGAEGEGYACVTFVILEPNGRTRFHQVKICDFLKKKIFICNIILTYHLNNF